MVVTKIVGMKWSDDCVVIGSNMGKKISVNNAGSPNITKNNL